MRFFWWILFAFYTTPAAAVPAVSKMSLRQLTSGTQANASLDLSPVSGDDGLPLCYSAASQQYTPATPVLSTGGALDFQAKWVIQGAGAPLMAADTNFKVTTFKLTSGELLVFASWDSQVSANLAVAGLTNVSVVLPDAIMPKDTGDGVGSIVLTNDPDPGAGRIACTITTVSGVSGAGRLVATPSVATTGTANPLVVPGGTAFWISTPL